MSHLFNPIKECFRCGFEIQQPKCVFLYTPKGDVARIGPMFEVNYKLDIPHDDIEGLPIMLCSANCALDALSVMFKENPESFTVYCILLAGIYDVCIPGLSLKKKYNIERKSLNKDPKSLLRWGGSETYTKYRRDFICPPPTVQIEVNGEKDDDELISQVKKLDDEMLPSDPLHHFTMAAENDLITVIDDETPIEGEFDFIDPALRKHFD